MFVWLYLLLFTCRANLLTLDHFDYLRSSLKAMGDKAIGLRPWVRNKISFYCYVQSNCTLPTCSQRQFVVLPLATSIKSTRLGRVQANEGTKDHIVMRNRHRARRLAIHDSCTKQVLA
jgi:hypothetical protein